MAESKIRSIGKTFEIIRTIQDLDGASLTAIARELDMP